MRYRSLLFTLLLPLVACDTFHIVNAVVLDGNTGKADSGANATLVLDKGVEEPDKQAVSDSRGAFNIFMNEPGSAWTTLTVQKDGYEVWSRQFQGAPSRGFEIKLKPNDDDEKER